MRVCRGAQRTKKLARDDPDALAMEGRKKAEAELIEAGDADEQAEMVKKLRTAARRKYLKEREQKKLSEAVSEPPRKRAPFESTRACARRALLQRL